MMGTFTGLYEENRDHMAKTKIALIGLGLIGKSMGKALSQAGAPAHLEIVGHDREPLAAREAQRVHAVARTCWNVIEACRDADIVIIATPPRGVRETLEAIAHDLKPRCLVMDTSSLKVPVLKWADELLPDGVSFVGGNPILTERIQIEPSLTEDRSRADLFKGAIFCLTPSNKATQEATHLAADVVRLVGATPFFVDPAEHDGLIAGVEHLPIMLGLALLRIMSNEPSWREIRKVAGPPFADVTRILTQDPSTSSDTLLLNRDNVVRLIDVWVAELNNLRGLIETQDQNGLEQAIEAGVAAHQHWLKDREAGLWEKPPPPELPARGGFLGRMLGRWGDSKTDPDV